jgi:hypothetical protein
MKEKVDYFFTVDVVLLLTSDFFGAFFDFLTFLAFFVVSAFLAGVGVGLDVTSAANTLHDNANTNATTNEIIFFMVVYLRSYGFCSYT